MYGIGKVMGLELDGRMAKRVNELQGARDEGGEQRGLPSNKPAFWGGQALKIRKRLQLRKQRKQFAVFIPNP
jgi:hypothetical protein